MTIKRKQPNPPKCEPVEELCPNRDIKLCTHTVAEHMPAPKRRAGEMIENNPAAMAKELPKVQLTSNELCVLLKLLTQVTCDIRANTAEINAREKWEFDNLQTAVDKLERTYFEMRSEEINK